MSLYDSIANALFTNTIGDGINSTLGGALDTLGGSKFGNAVLNIGASMARNAAVGLANKYAPSITQGVTKPNLGAMDNVMNGNGNFDSLGLGTPLFGGISLAEARKIYQEMRSIKHCRKNLFLIEVSSQLMGDISGRFNLFVIDLDYSPLTISGEKRKIGAAHVDCVNSSDPVELKITTMDDTSGFIKNWFRTHHAATAAVDGTVGLPINYAIKIKIIHGFITHGSNQGGYEDIGLFRCANMDTSMSRREDGLQEVPLSFVQLDTFMKP